MINEQLRKFCVESHSMVDEYLDKPISASEVACASKSLKIGKAAGHDTLTNEHLKYGGVFLHTFLANLFSAILSIGYVPTEMKKGVIITLIKDRHNSTLYYQWCIRCLR